MKSGIHPQLNPVVFVDGDHEFVTLSTLRSTTTRDIDGVEHFVIPVEISSASHPFFTGEQRIIDTAGQVERFMRRLEAGVSQREDDLRREAERKQAAKDAKAKRRGLTPLQPKAAAKPAAKKATPKPAADAGDAAE
ncbi:MAG: 50S ribosomal protein L31 [Caldilineae bacterium]|nr:50S ribosomal protein L31 [Chloroflexota bacterium]MCB9176236.1 50S ribosomal protein L31 [Caldilineae bacterium]